MYIFLLLGKTGELYEFSKTLLVLKWGFGKFKELRGPKNRFNQRSNVNERDSRDLNN